MLQVLLQTQLNHRVYQASTADSTTMVPGAGQMALWPYTGPHAPPPLFWLLTRPVPSSGAVFFFPGASLALVNVLRNARALLSSRCRFQYHQPFSLPISSTTYARQRMIIFSAITSSCRCAGGADHNIEHDSALSIVATLHTNAVREAG